MTPSGIYKNYELVVGLEIHVQLDTNSKLFCCAAAGVSSQPNEHVGAVSLGLPGALPILNEQAVQYAIMAGLALGCDIQETSVFARKHYFYPDLPKGYQISQYDQPLCLNGYIQLSDGKKIGITRIHMEEDAGKLVHQGASGLAGSSGSLVDLNRAGIPLIEIVSEPDIRTPQEARQYMEKVHEIVRFIGVCDGDLEKGSFRCDANVSVRPVGTPQFGTRTETKNLNSFRSVEQAIQHEFHRQVDALLAGETIVQQTRHYDDATGTTTALRTKEEAHDYRYFP
ncbi:MAG: Asp-tRNA(Asn)/Glu-tRNA(Gln) amidotransferase subunit GatB, partial [bacterium]|nr:Asp-tRNA(Asn)/Glu-tRNA(Gln) amidotransferase subunit GatB [bacterium]